MIKYGDNIVFVSMSRKDFNGRIHGNQRMLHCSVVEDADTDKAKLLDEGSYAFCNVCRRKSDIMDKYTLKMQDGIYVLSVSYTWDPNENGQWMLMYWIKDPLEQEWEFLHEAMMGGGMPPVSIANASHLRKTQMH